MIARPLVLLVALGALLASAPADALTLRDMLGRTVTLPAWPAVTGDDTPLTTNWGSRLANLATKASALPTLL